MLQCQPNDAKVTFSSKTQKTGLSLTHWWFLRRTRNQPMVIWSVEESSSWGILGAQLQLWNQRCQTLPAPSITNCSSLTRWLHNYHLIFSSTCARSNYLISVSATSLWTSIRLMLLTLLSTRANSLVNIWLKTRQLVNKRVQMTAVRISIIWTWIQRIATKSRITNNSNKTS